MGTVVRCTVLLAALTGALAAIKIPFKHHSYDAFTSVLVNMTNARPDLATMYSVGKSIHGRDLWVVMVTSRSTADKLLKPSVKYVANMHGNEVVGKELMLHLIAHLLNGYDSDPRIRWLLDNTNVHVMPSMNPDGMSVSTEGQCKGVRGRYNSAGVDLNRNFPEYGQSRSYREQPETTAIKKWIDTIQFVLSGNLHGGAMLVRYPFDSALTPGQVGSTTPDEDVFQYLGRTYSFNHPTMRRFSCEDQLYKDGIVNGADWYPFKGSMPDYTYLQAGSMELTLELSCCKYPPSYQLQGYWHDNVKSLMRFMEEAHRGVRGIVSNDVGTPIPRATLMIKGRYIPFRTTENGEYWRILLPGSYVLMVSAPEHIDAEVPFDIIDGRTTVVNVTLVPKNREYQNLYDGPFQKPGFGSNADLSSLTADDGDAVNALSSIAEQRLPTRPTPSRAMPPVAPLATKEQPAMSLADYYYALYKAVRQLTSGQPGYRDPRLTSEQMAERLATAFRGSMASHQGLPFVEPKGDPEFQRRMLEEDVLKLQSHTPEISQDTLPQNGTDHAVNQGGVSAALTALPLTVPPSSPTSYDNRITPPTSLPTQGLLSTAPDVFRGLDNGGLPSPLPTEPSLPTTSNTPSTHSKIYIPSSIPLPPSTLQRTTPNMAGAGEITSRALPLPTQPTEPSSTLASSQGTSAPTYPSQSFPQTTGPVVYSSVPYLYTPPSARPRQTETIPQDVTGRQSVSSLGTTPTTQNDQTYKHGETHAPEMPPTTPSPHEQTVESYQMSPAAPQLPDVQKQQEEVSKNTSVPNVQQQATLPPTSLQPTNYSRLPPSTVVQTTQSFPATASIAPSGTPLSTLPVTRASPSTPSEPPGQSFTGATLLQRPPQTTQSFPAAPSIVPSRAPPSTPPVIQGLPRAPPKPPGQSFTGTTLLQRPPQTTQSFPAIPSIVPSGAPPSTPPVTQSLPSTRSGPPGQSFTGATLLQRPPQTTQSFPATPSIVPSGVPPSTPPVTQSLPSTPSGPPGSFTGATLLQRPPQTAQSFPATPSIVQRGAPPSTPPVTRGLPGALSGHPGPGRTLFQRLPQTTVTDFNRPAITGPVTPSPQLLQSRPPLSSSTPGSRSGTVTALRRPLLIPETVIKTQDAALQAQIARIFPQGYGKLVIPPRLPGIHGSGSGRTSQVHAIVQRPYSVPPAQYQRTELPTATSTSSPPTTKSGIGDEPCCFDGPNSKFIFRIGK